MSGSDLRVGPPSSSSHPSEDSPPFGSQREDGSGHGTCTQQNFANRVRSPGPNSAWPLGWATVRGESGKRGKGGFHLFGF